MKKETKCYQLLLTVSMLFVINNIAFSQLYVSPNKSIYNKGSLLYVAKDINLDSGSVLYLRNEGQLLQGGTGSFANSGTGKLSVFQEGTSNNYIYNFWCSPVGGTSTSSGNDKFGITMLGVPSSNTATNPANILPMTNHNGTCSTASVSIAPYWIWKYINSDIYDLDNGGWISVFSATDINAGEGFTMKGTSGSDATNVGEATVNNPYSVSPVVASAQRYDFRGRPNNGTITVPVANNKMTLTGNPYPSALNVNAFLLDSGNIACNATAYYWEQDKTIPSHVLTDYRGGYGTYVPGTLASTGVYTSAYMYAYNADGTINISITAPQSGLAIERKYAPIGQGFLIKGTGLGSSVSIKNAHREFYKEAGALSEFYRSTSATSATNTSSILSHIKINTTINNQSIRQVALIFDDNATDGVDRGFDGLSPDDDLFANDAYFWLNNQNFVIQGVKFNEDKQVAFGIKASGNTTFKISLVDVVNFNVNQNIFVFDSLTNIYHNLLESDFEITLPQGVYNDRFKITFKKNSNVSNSGAEATLSISQNNKTQMATIFNVSELNLQSINVFDITGKITYQKESIGDFSSFSFSTLNFSEGVYIIAAEDANHKKFTKKIIVKK